MTDELKDEAQQRNAKVREQAAAMQVLINLPAWKIFQEMVQESGQVHYATMTQPLETVDMCVKTEYAKGTLNGLGLCVSLPYRKIEELKSLRVTSNEEGNNE